MDRLTKEDTDILYGYVGGDYGPEALKGKCVEKLRWLHDSVEKRMLSDMHATQEKLDRANAKLEKIRLEKQESAEEGVYETLDYNSTEIARAVLFASRQMGVTIDSDKRFYLIVVAAYCSWLGRHRQRLTVDHPVAFPYGPIFTKMYNEKNGVHIRDTVTDEEYNTIRTENPGVAKMLVNAVRKYADVDLADLQNLFTQKGSPWDTVKKKVNKGTAKWNTPLSDKEIYLWKNTRS